MQRVAEHKAVQLDLGAISKAAKLFEDLDDDDDGESAFLDTDVDNSEVERKRPSSGAASCTEIRAAGARSTARRRSS